MGLTRIQEERKNKNQADLDQFRSEDFKFKRNKHGLEYFPCSIVQTSLGDGQVENVMNIFKEGYTTPDAPIPEESILGRMKGRDVKMLYCITMYDENFGQLLQSLAG